MLSKLTRRKFIQQLSLGVISTPMLMEALKGELLAQTAEEPHKSSLIWFRGNSSHVQSMSRGSSAEERNFISQYFHTLDFLGSEISTDDYPLLERHILILEGRYSADINHPNAKVLKKLVSKSRVVILLGSEACYQSTPEGYLDLEQDILYSSGMPIIKIPGDPAQMFHLVGSLYHLIKHGLPHLDEVRRPTMFFSQNICKSCMYRADFEDGNFVSSFGAGKGCLYLLGCKGPWTKNTCSVQGFNQAQNWCVGAGAPCTGCSEPTYPDNEGLGLYGQMIGDSAGVNSTWLRHADTIGMIALGTTAAGLAVHAVTQKDAKTPIVVDLDEKEEAES